MEFLGNKNFGSGRITAGLLVFFVLCALLIPGCSFLRIFGNRSDVESIAVMPFENYSDDPNVQALLMPMLIQQLSRKGLIIAPEEELMDILLKNRVRSFASVSSGLAKEIGEKLNVQSVLVGSVVYLRNVKDDLQIGLAARLIDTASGRIIWADYVSLSGREFKSVLGLGGIKQMDKLVSKSVKRLFSSFKAHYRHTESKYRLAVMTFRNNSENKAAGIMVTGMFVAELFKRGHYEVIEPGDVKRMMLENRLRSNGEMDFSKIEVCSNTLNADGILLGSVDMFSNPDSLPNIEISIRLINAHNNKILMLDSLHFSGEKDIIAFTWQEFKAADKTAYQAVSKLSRKVERVKWN